MRNPKTGRLETNWTGTKICKSCDKEFLATSGMQLKCSDCRKCEWCGAQLKYSHRKFCNNSCAGKWKYRNSEDVKLALEFGVKEADEKTQQKRAKSISKYLTGKPRLELRGENNPNWNGGYGSERHQAMGKVEYKNWRREVFERDDFTCFMCEKRGKKLNAHHILSWRDYESERYNLFNGITVCVDCHKTL